MFEGVRGGEGRRATFWKTDLQASRKNFVLRLNTANLLRKPKIHTSPKNFFGRRVLGLIALNFYLCVAVPLPWVPQRMALHGRQGPPALPTLTHKLVFAKLLFSGVFAPHKCAKSFAERMNFGFATQICGV